MKSTKVQTLVELCMRDTAKCVVSDPASSSRRVWHGLVTVVDSMRESIHAIRCDFLSPQGTHERADRCGRSNSTEGFVLLQQARMHTELQLSLDESGLQGSYS